MANLGDTQLRTKALSVLRQFYGFSSFRPMQFEIISHAMHGNDSLVLMPTGGGKSMCFQIPALLSDGCAIVVSPLLALMNDQVRALQANGIPAAMMSSEQTEAANRDVAEHVYGGQIKLLYISPERLLSEIDNWSQALKVSLIAIDEAHCISQWGHDFRPEYTKLSVLKQRFPQVPIMALTATADKITRDDIVKQLGISDARMFISSFDRPNISLNVLSDISGRAKLRTIARFIEARPGQSGIIYCLSRKNTETMAANLQRMGINARAFHAGMSAAEKRQVQESFINDDVPVVVATIAFGMGIDKSNVRWVIHSNMPKSLEEYYQEIGRAGRDGDPADALMFYSFGDVATLMHFANESGQSKVNVEKLHRMQQYAESSVCRRRILLSYFNERFDHDCGNCDVCREKPKRIDGTIVVQMALSAILRTGERVGFTTCIDILRGSRKAELVQAGFDRIKTYGVGRSLSFAAWNAYLLQMLQMGIIDVAYNEGNHLKVTDYGRELLANRTKVLLSEFHYRDKIVRRDRKADLQLFGAEASLTASDEALFDYLKGIRLGLARARGIAPYMVFSDKVLRIMAHERPTTKVQFATLYGVGQAKTAAYWAPFTSAIVQWQRSQQ